jgi:hypothetical protein
MPKEPTKSLDYFVISCQSSKGPINLGVFGSVTLPEISSSVCFFVSSVPDEIPGLDEFGHSMAVALPETVGRDTKELTRKNLPSSELLAELANRYRGTIFAGAPARWKFALPRTADQPKKLAPKIMEQALMIAVKNLDQLREQKNQERRPARSAKRPPRRAKPRHILSKLPHFESQVLFA